MDATITNLFAPILDKLARQDSNDGVLLSFLKEVAGKYSIKQTRAIKQPDPQSRTNNTGNDPNLQNIFTEFKKLYKDILRDQSYRTDYKLFLKKILDKDLLNDTGKKERLDLIPGVDKPLLVIIDGLSKKGADDFRDKLLKNLFKDLNISLSKTLKDGFSKIKKDEKGLIEELLDAVPDFSFGMPVPGGGRNRKRPGGKRPSRPRPSRGRGRIPVPPVLPGKTPKPAPVPKGAPPVPTPKPAPVPKGAPPVPTPKPAPVPKGAPPVPKAPKPAPVPKGAPPVPKAPGGAGGMLGKAGGLLGKLALPLMTAYEAYTNISDSLSELTEKKTLTPGQKVGTGGMALAGGAADVVTTVFDPTSWGLDKMFGYDIFGEGLLKEGLNVIGAKEEDQTMGESLRERMTDLFESVNYSAEDALKNQGMTEENAKKVLGLKEQESRTDYAKIGAKASLAPMIGPAAELIDAIPLKEGGLVMPQNNKPTLASIAEPGNPEVVVPIDRLFKEFQTSLNTDSLNEIADNTKNTNQSLNALADAIIKMVGAFNQKASVQGSTTVINAGGGSKDPTSASMAANFNLDPIRRVRSQFAV